jgi:hypothetical protein
MIANCPFEFFLHVLIGVPSATQHLYRPANDLNYSSTPFLNSSEIAFLNSRIVPIHPIHRHMSTRALLDMGRNPMSATMISSRTLWTSYTHERPAARLRYGREVKDHREQAICTPKTQQGALLQAVKEACLARNEAVLTMRADHAAMGVSRGTTMKPALVQPERMIDLRAGRTYDEQFDDLPERKKDHVRQTLRPA